MVKKNISINIDYIIKKNLKSFVNKDGIIQPKFLLNKIRESKKIYEERGAITLGQLKEFVEKGKYKKIEVYRTLKPKKTKLEENLIQLSTKKMLLEKFRNAPSIRQIVKDIIKIYKNEDEGEFYLPEDSIDDTLEYFLSDSSISIELILSKSKDVQSFLVNANFYKQEDIIVVKIVYNPDKKNQSIYNLIGELNELIAHELRHQYQRDKGLYGMDNSHNYSKDEEEIGIDYYSKPEEIDAQVDGFKRMKNVTGRPFEELVKNWFRTHTEIHGMDTNEQNQVISMILKHYRQSQISQ